ncbi:alpha/beta hydrolase family esterase [Tautonia marina]|uniref:alpha/beta hydrolase family esterase n=1 Tax=Tautonia marina TaxID=2653855 RepID=UPI001261363D|nr:PHB depolymerase family esterase [Tautonia marina]
MTAPPPIPPDRARWLGVIVLAVLALAARRTENPEAFANSTHPRFDDSQEGRHQGTIEVAGHSWSFALHVPAGYEADSDRQWPLVLALHGASGSGTAFLDEAGWDDLADREGVIIAAPSGLPMRPEVSPSRVFNPRLWNSRQHPPDRPRSQVDDLAFFDALLDEITRRWRIDPDRIYAAGHSNGGAMALRLAAERSEVFAAVASVAGLRYVEPPNEARGVSILTIFGGADPLLPTEGGLSVLPWEVRRTPEILPELKRYAAQIGCPQVDTVIEHDGPMHFFFYPPSPEGATLGFILLDRHGHAWPGGQARLAEPLLIGPRNDLIDATAVIWKFFAHRRRRSDEPS